MWFVLDAMDADDAGRAHDSVPDTGLAAAPGEPGGPYLLRAWGPGLRLVVGDETAGTGLVRHASSAAGWCVIVGSPLALAGRGVAEVMSGALEAGPGAGEVLRRLEGAFVALHVDAATGAATLVTDPLGLQPLYRARNGRCTAWASTVRGAVAACDLPVEEDLSAIGALIVLGHLLGDRTVARGVERVPPATIVRLEGGREHRRTYWSLPTDARDPMPLDAHTAELERALRRWYEASRREHPLGTLFVSGGYDSRLAAGLVAAYGERPGAVTLRHRNEDADADYHVARAVCRALGISPEVVDPPADYFDSDAYAEYVERTEAATASLFLYIATIQLARPSIRGAAWDGLLPGFLSVTHYEAGGFRPYLAYLTGNAIDRVRRAPFRDEWLEVCLSAFHELLQEEVARWPDTPAGVLGFGLRNRARLRFAPNAIRVLGSYAPVHLPGGTCEFWEGVSRVPVEMRQAGRMHAALLGRLAPELLHIPVVSRDGVAALSRQAWVATQGLRWRGRLDDVLRERPRARRYAATLGLKPFRWCGSERAMECVQTAFDEPLVHDVHNLETRIAGRSRFELDDTVLLPVLHRLRALSLLSGTEAASEAA